jgi:hypothetical protein
MQTADWALIISILSAVGAFASFLWNVWSKFIYPKPVVRVSFGMVTISQNGEPVIEVLRLMATNMVPIDVTLTQALTMYREHPFTDEQYGILNLLPRAPLSNDLDSEFASGGGPAASLPKTLAVGETYSAYLVPDHETLARGTYRHIGFNDTFNHCHWAPKSNMIRALPYIREACEKAGKNWRVRLPQ